MVTNSMEKAQGSFPYLYTLFITLGFKRLLFPPFEESVLCRRR